MNNNQWTAAGATAGGVIGTAVAGPGGGAAGAAVGAAAGRAIASRRNDNAASGTDNINVSTDRK